jgi:hypothetical protein
MLESNGHTVHVQLNTYSLNEYDDAQLLDYYKRKSTLVKTVFLKSQMPNQLDFYNSVYDSLLPTIDDYDFVLLIRIDFYLRKEFSNCFRFDDKQILFIHIDSNIELNDNFLVNHGCILYPKYFFNTIKEKIVYNEHHGIKNKLLSSGLTKYDIGYMIRTLHVCSTDLGWNPLYIQVGRDYHRGYNSDLQYCHKVEYYFYELSQSFIHDCDKTTEFYKHQLNIDSLEENLENLKVSTFDELD